MIKRLLLISSALILIFGLSFFVLLHPMQQNATYIIAKANFGRSRFFLTQTYRGVFDMNSIRLVVKDYRGSWKRYYISHEDTYWRNAKLELVNDTIQVKRGNNIIAQYNVKSEVFYLNESSGVERSSPLEISNSPIFLEQDSDTLVKHH